MADLYRGKGLSDKLYEGITQLCGLTAAPDDAFFVMSGASGTNRLYTRLGMKDMNMRVFIKRY